MHAPELADAMARVFDFHGYKTTRDATLEGRDGSLYTVPLLAEYGEYAVLWDYHRNDQPVTRQAMQRVSAAVAEVGAQVAVLAHTQRTEVQALPNVAIWDEATLTRVLGQTRLAEATGIQVDALPLTATKQAATSVEETMPPAFQMQPLSPLQEAVREEADAEDSTQPAQAPAAGVDDDLLPGLDPSLFSNEAATQPEAPPAPPQTPEPTPQAAPPTSLTEPAMPQVAEPTQPAPESPPQEVPSTANEVAQEEAVAGFFDSLSAAAQASDEATAGPPEPTQPTHTEQAPQAPSLPNMEGTQHTEAAQMTEVPPPRLAHPLLPLRFPMESAKAIAQDRLFGIHDVRLLLQPVHLFAFECDLITEGSLRYDTVEGFLQVHATTRDVEEVGARITDSEGAIQVPDELLGKARELTLRTQVDRADEVARGALLEHHTRVVNVEVEDEDHNFTSIEKRKVEPRPDHIRLQHQGIHHRPIWRLAGNNGTMDVDGVSGAIVAKELTTPDADAVVLD